MNNVREPRKVVVLGASGFLGSAMAEHLAKAGHHVTSYCRQPTSLAASFNNVTTVTADLRDTWILADVIANADVVYHFASATHPSLFYSNPSSEYWEALQPLLVLMETAARVGVKKIVFPSSGGTIYADSDLPRIESSPTDPRSPYAVFKLTAEQLLHHSARMGQFSVDIFRVGNPYGPGQPTRPGQGVLPHWINAIQNSKPIKVFGDGTAERDYVFVDDLCRLMSLSLNRLNESETFNLGTGVATSLRKLLHHIQSMVEVPIEVQYLARRSSDIQSIALAPDRLLSQIPAFCFTPLAEGVKRTLQYHKLI
ncbi:NAD-dependent epimerase/dehydratase family protein [Novipirellula sp.]|uniref:NAD-dependent epimerase/dehydratase family protein n=1 Tax=Novipirellula sp. TaxID=2795430 RepID=UPI00356ABC22